MNNQPGTNARSPVPAEPTTAWVCHRYEELQREMADFAEQLTALEKQNARSSRLLKMLGQVFGIGPGGKLERARFKLNYKREQLGQFESAYL